MYKIIGKRDLLSGGRSDILSSSITRGPRSMSTSGSIIYYLLRSWGNLEIAITKNTNIMMIEIERNRIMTRLFKWSFFPISMGEANQFIK